MLRSVLACVVAVAGCSPTKALAIDAPSPTPSTTASIGRDASAWPAALPVPMLPAPAPIAAAGYPVPLQTCLPDPAHHAGFTSDGAELGYCMDGMSLACEFVDRAGHHRSESLLGDPTVEKTAAIKAKEKAIETWLGDAGVPVLKKADCKFHPPPLKGVFRYGDIKLSVATVPGTFNKTTRGDEPISEPVVKIGGSVAGEAPVFPFIYGRPGRKPKEPARYSNGTAVNLLALSPDETEIGIVTHTNCMEYCDEFEIIRMPVERFASGIYNDAGFRAHKGGNLPRAIELFARAAYIDPQRELPAYNLACAYARSGDVTKAEAALDLAIRRGGVAVKTRARDDADFKDQKTAPWFVNLTAR